MQKNKNLIMGTWEFEKSHKNLSDAEVKRLLRYAKKCGIFQFDTALVYDNERIEKLMGSVLGKKDFIITKIPAKRKPQIDEVDSAQFYDGNHIENCLQKSLKNLKRNYIDCVLLHNWAYGWDASPIKKLNEFKQKGLIKNIGISIPNNYNKVLDKNILNFVDAIEIPYNSENLQNEKIIEYYKNLGKQVYIRSIFRKNKDIKENGREVEYCKKIKCALKFDCPLVIGMTTHKQIHNNNLWSQSRTYLKKLVMRSIFNNEFALKSKDRVYNLNRLLFKEFTKIYIQTIRCARFL